MSGKATLQENEFSGTQISEVNVGIDGTSFYKMQFVAQAPTSNNADARAGYGFHNAGTNGGALYLDVDGKLKFKPLGQDGITYIINWTLDE